MCCVVIGRAADTRASHDACSRQGMSRTRLKLVLSSLLSHNLNPLLGRLIKGRFLTPECKQYRLAGSSASVIGPITLGDGCSLTARRLSACGRRRQQAQPRAPANRFRQGRPRQCRFSSPPNQGRLAASGRSADHRPSGKRRQGWLSPVLACRRLPARKGQVTSRAIFTAGSDSPFS
jgi:hypothetical protein